MINNVDNGKYDTYKDFWYIKNNTSQILGTSFTPKKCKLTSCAVIAMKPTYMVFGKIIDNIK